MLTIRSFWTIKMEAKISYLKGGLYKNHCGWILGLTSKPCLITIPYSFTTAPLHLIFMKGRGAGHNSGRQRIVFRIMFKN